WMSSQPWPPAARTCRRIAAPRPLALIRSKYKGRPPKEVRPWLDGSASYWKSSSPCATIAHPVGDGFRIAIQDYLPDESGPTGNLNFLDAESRRRHHRSLIPIAAHLHITSRRRTRLQSSRRQSGGWPSPC